jgi:hypothetical protein
LEKKGGQGSSKTPHWTMEQAGALAVEWRTLVDNEIAAAARESRIPAVFEMECRLGGLEDRNFVPGITQSDAERACALLQKMLKSEPAAKPSGSDTKTSFDPNQKTSSDPNQKKFSTSSVWESAMLSGSTPRRIVRAEETRIDDSTHLPASDAVMSSGGNLRARSTTVVHTDPPNPKLKDTKKFELISKDRLAFVDMRVLQRKYDCRLALKREQPARNASAHLGQVTSRRSQLRRSFWTSDGCRIDLSAIASYEGGSTAGRGPPQLTGPTTFEAEIEIVDTTLSPDDAIAGCVHWLLLLQSCFARPKSCDAVDGRLLFLRVDEDENAATKGKELEGITADVLLVSVSRSVCRVSK